MESHDESSAVAVGYIVRGINGILGPFTVDGLRAGVAGGHFALHDAVRREDSTAWCAIEDVLGEAASFAPENGAELSWKAIIAAALKRLRADVASGSLVPGLALVVIGGVAMLLARWPATLWAPWFLLPAAGSVIAFKRGSIARGVVLLCAVAAMPVGVHFTDKKIALRLAAQQSKTPDIAAATAPTSEPPAPPGIVGTPLAAAVPDLVSEPALTTKFSPMPAEPPGVAIASPSLPPPDALPVQPAVASAVVPPANGLPPLPAREALAAKGAPTPSAPPAEAEAPPASAEERRDWAERKAAELVANFRDALVLASGKEGSGSGFICKVDGRTWLFTNIHVTAGMHELQFKKLDATVLGVGAAEAAVGRDIMRLAFKNNVSLALDALPDFEVNARIGDDVAVLGNSGGGGVITALTGRLLGIGPDRIEVNAEFIPGNSGSPIIHLKSGRVIGIATYLTKRYDDFGSAKGAPPKVRRFGFRIDKVPQWQPVNWVVFQSEAEQLHRIGELTGDVFDFVAALRKRATPEFATDTLRRPANDWLAAISRPRSSLADREHATQGFLGALRTMVRADVTAADGQIRYGYFRERLKEEREVRDKLYKAFDEEAKLMSSPSTRNAR